MRLVVVLLTCLLVPSVAVGKPTRHGVDAFAGDRWEMVAQAGTSAADVNRSMGCPPPHCVRVKRKKRPRHEGIVKAQRPVTVIVPAPRVRPEPPMDADQEAAYRVIAALLANGKVYVKPLPFPDAGKPKPTTLMGGLVREVGRVFGMPQRFIRGRLICAVNVNAALAERGIRGTRSALAKSFLHWGRPSRAVPGAVAVFNRGRSSRSGHVAIVHHVKPNGQVIYLNPSASRQRWVIGPYRKRPIGYRVAA